MSYIKREIEDKVIGSLESNKAIFILGARQVGKTTLLQQLKNVVGEENSLYYDIEFPDNLELFSGTIENILSRWRFERKNPGSRCYVFLDEIQYINDFSKKVKLLTDHYADEFKLIMTGSSSAMIRYQFKESLVGRKEIYILYPLNFREFCYFKGEEKIARLVCSGEEVSPTHPLLLISSHIEMLMSEFITFGGFPEVVLSNSSEKKITLLNEIVSSYIIKDIKNLFQIEKIEQVNRLIRCLAENTGKEMNISELAKDVGLHRETLQKYLNILEDSFIIGILRPFYSNLNKELRKMPKAYLLDTGLRNMLVKNFTLLSKRQDKGELVENAFFNRLYYSKNAATTIHYWKTKAGQEIDFIKRENDLITAYEVKYGDDRTNHFNSFRNKYPQAICRFVRFHYRHKENELPFWF